jgi:hemoglobin
MAARERTRPIHVPRGGPPAGQPPSPEILAAVGEEGVVRMLEDFYRELETSEVRGLFPEDMVQASRKSAAFFIQVLGGRPLYSQHFGPPRMRQRHEPYEIDAAARAVWLACFDRVLAGAENRYGFPPEHLEGFRGFLESFSGWMVNAE